MRDSRAYPLRGYFASCEIRKTGILPQDSYNLFYLKILLKKYVPLNTRFYAASAIYGKISSRSSQPYFIKKGLGYREYVHGYEYYVIDGIDYFTYHVLFKYELFPTRIFHLRFIPFKKFNKIFLASYINCFFNTGYVIDNTVDYLTHNNNLVNTMLYSTGLGLDLVTYYDRVLRIEYSINKMKERGFFIEFKAPI